MNLKIIFTTAFLLAILILATSLALYRKTNKVNVLSKQLNNLEQKKDGFATSLRIINKDLMDQLTSEDISIDENTSLTNTNGEKTDFLKLIGTSKKLIFRYSKINCNLCVDKQIEYLKTFGNEIGPENIIILASYKNQRDCFAFMRINQLQMQLYNIDSLGLPVEQNDKPFYFLLDNSFRTKLVFVTSKEEPQKTLLYFNNIKKRLIAN